MAQAQAALPHFIIRFSTVPLQKYSSLIEVPFEFLEALRVASGRHPAQRDGLRSWRQECVTLSYGNNTVGI